jgi:hypothetical protein
MIYSTLAAAFPYQLKADTPVKEIHRGLDQGQSQGHTRHGRELKEKLDTSMPTLIETGNLLDLSR